MRVIIIITKQCEANGIIVYGLAFCCYQQLVGRYISRPS